MEHMRQIQWTPERIKRLRKAFGESQEEFCRRFRIGLGTLRFWEQGRSSPTGPATIILDQLNEQVGAVQAEELQPA